MVCGSGQIMLQYLLILSIKETIISYSLKLDPALSLKSKNIVV